MYDGPLLNCGLSRFLPEHVMSVSVCPQCAEQVTIPAGASPQARVRCPLCLEQYDLADALDRLPPTLEVLSDAGSSRGGAAATSHFNFGGSSSSTAVAETDAGAAEFQFDERPAPGVSKPAAGRPAAARPAPRPKRKPKKPAVEIAKVVGGGVVGIVLAVLLIWWIAGKDPFKIAPKVNGFAPFLVPQKVMDRYEKNGDEPDEPANDDDKKTDENQNTRDGRERGKDANRKSSHNRPRDRQPQPATASSGTVIAT